MDPTNTRASSRSLRGLDRELNQTRTDNHPHPHNGGSRGYTLWQRVRALNSLLIYQDYAIASQSIGCHPISVRRWEQRLTPYRMNGGKERQFITAED